MAATGAWLVGGEAQNGAALRCFCFPYSGASAAVFARWGGSFPGAIQICPVELPGRGRRMAEPLFTDLPSLVRAVAAGLEPYLDRPFALFGHSLGAVVAFELARYLKSEGGPAPAHLFASGHAAPQLADERPPIYDLPDDQFIAKLREFGGTPEEVLAHRELMALLMPMLRADFEVSETYAYQAGEPLACAITALGGVRDPYVSRADLEAWGEQTSGPFSVSMFPGDHFYLHTDEHDLIAVMAGKLMRRPLGHGG